MESPGEYTQKRLMGITAVDAFAARRLTDGLEALLLIMRPSCLKGIAEWPQSRGFHTELRDADPKTKDKTRLHLQLTEERYREVFYALCEDVCTVLATSDADRSAVQACHTRLVRWQNFLQKHRPDGLSPEQQTGLFGELLVLRDLLLPLDPLGTIRAWRGCNKANQDFQYPGKALEVKTTRATIPDRVSISNVQQLDEDGLSPLVLTVVHVHANETSGETLPELVNSVRAMIPPNLREIFEEGLIEAGYLDAQVELYEQIRYQVNEVLHHEVQEGFPRVLRDQLPEGVKNVRYEISIDAARPFRVEEARVREIFHSSEHRRE